MAEMTVEMTEKQKELARRLIEVDAVKFGAFELKLYEKYPNALLSPIYFNLRTPEISKSGTLSPDIIRMIGEVLYELAREEDLEFDLVAGIPNAGSPLAETFIDEAIMDMRRDFHILELKKEEQNGKRRISGIATDPRLYNKGDKVLLIDDLITKADSKTEAIRVLGRESLIVEDLLVLVDREQGGAEEIRRMGYNLYPVFRLTNLLRFYLDENKINQAKYDEVMNYLKNA